MEASGAGVTRQRRSARGDLARDRILRAAVQAVAREGFQGCSLARIAADVGMSQAGLLHHFRSKEDLMVAVLAERDRLDIVQFGLDDEGVGGVAVLDALGRLVGYNAHIPGTVQAYTVLAGESVAEQHPARAWFTERYDRIRSAVADGLRRGVGTGEIRRDVDCDAVAAEVLATMDGLQLQWLLDPDGIDMAAVFDGYLDRLRAALRA